ncbi:response regulator [Desulfovibrio aerotolerans]|uniref:Sensory/regulatory protein RpfC n=1 Tax=Solidesulfovibrio aerotolerans TaxID=295255 RepID=A0A7C9MV05_9BACT|nr:response regulator [Solidesulfovibrio aerotolerans]MYL83174.1 response regulator [Solidesulfovibrio aerotolerans]
MLEGLIRETDALGVLTGDGWLLVDNNGIIVHATPEAGPFFGLPASQLTGLPLGIRLDGQPGRRLRLPASDRLVSLRWEAVPQPDLPLTRVLLRDVTALATAENQLAAAREAAQAGERAKNHFLANITHEIRTPMIGILGMTELTLATELAPKQREYLEMARHSAQSLLTVLNDIVDYARIEVGVLELARLPFDLRATAEEVISVFKPLAAKKGVSLTFRFVGAVPQTLLGDASRLRQVLVNLVGNAVKFTDAGSVVLVIARTGQGQAASQLRLRFEVRDTGIGIPADKIQAIFDSFTQADVSPARRYQGAGLGLAIVRHLVGMMGGTYGVDSVEGTGSAFTFEIECALPESFKDAVAPEVVQEPSSLRPLTILLAEDNPINQIYVQELLEMDGHEVVVAHTGRRALEALRKKRFDAILMDIQMPEMDGLEATRAIRSDDSGDFDPAIPIVALTAHALKGDRETFLRAGMDEYLSKPVSPGDLAAALGRVMDAPAKDGTAAPAAPVTTGVVLDWAELLGKARGNTGFLVKLFGAFVAEQPGTLAAMREALAAPDLARLAFLAHSLKGASATMCAPALREACHDLERASRAGDPGRATAALAGVETTLDDVLTAMRAKIAAA